MSQAQNPLLTQRRAGLLLHPTSLPGTGPTGQIGAEAYHFVDWLQAAGFRLWQVLPLHPPQDDGSPYASISAFAGDIRLIDREVMVAEQWITPEQAQGALSEVLTRARVQVQAAQGQAWQDWQRFCEEQAEWLEPYSLFVVIKAQQQGRCWWTWPEALRWRDPQALAQVRATAGTALDDVRFAQFVFFRQWCRLKAYANARDILLLGDMPIFVAHDSADVWGNPQWFDLDTQGQPRSVAGVPPDYFSATGQRWGNPHYRWAVMGESGYHWWKQRLGWALTSLDGLRIDHFRGFEAYWAIPAEEPTAIAGRWEPGPGADFFNALLAHFGQLPLVAEDLGVITPEVNALREQFGLPGMKILQFAFGGDADNPYLPENHVEQGVVYTGTHDNDTTLGWFQALDAAVQAQVLATLGQPTEPMPWPLITTALASPACLVILPMQDVLALDGRHRMNTPGTMSEDNWCWRFQWDMVPASLAAHLRQLQQQHGRLA